MSERRVVVLGGGFAGVHTAKYLTEMLGPRSGVVVELLSEENYFVLQPLLPKVAAGGIAATHVVNPIREMVPRARFRHCKILGVDLASKQVLVSQGEGLEVVRVGYDHVVFCLGKITSFATMPSAAEHAFAMKDLGDAFRLRNHVVRCLESADIEHDPARKEVRFVLIHSQDALLPEMPRSLKAAAQEILEKRRVEVLLKARVRASSATMVYLADGRSVPTSTFVCTVGNAPNPIVKDTIRAGGFEEATVNGRGIGVFATDRMLRCSGPGEVLGRRRLRGRPGAQGRGALPTHGAVRHPRGEGVRQERLRRAARPRARAVLVRGARDARVARAAERGREALLPGAHRLRRVVFFGGPST